MEIRPNQVTGMAPTFNCTAVSAEVLLQWGKGSRGEYRAKKWIIAVLDFISSWVGRCSGFTGPLYDMPCSWVVVKTWMSLAGVDGQGFVIDFCVMFWCHQHKKGWNVSHSIQFAHNLTWQKLFAILRTQNPTPGITTKKNFTQELRQVQILSISIFQRRDSFLCQFLLPGVSVSGQNMTNKKKNKFSCACHFLAVFWKRLRAVVIAPLCARCHIVSTWQVVTGLQVYILPQSEEFQQLATIEKNTKATHKSDCFSYSPAGCWTSSGILIFLSETISEVLLWVVHTMSGREKPNRSLILSRSDLGTRWILEKTQRRKDEPGGWPAIAHKNQPAKVESENLHVVFSVWNIGGATRSAFFTDF